MPQIRLYNTFSRKKESLKSAAAGSLSMYVCGPTVYNEAHIGNARPAVVFDLLYRLLLCLYPRVIYARNITDIDDKIMRKAEQEALPIQDISSRYYRIYKEDMAALQVLPPTQEPWATAYIDKIIEYVQRLIESKHAYLSQGHVLFHVLSCPAYGSLSRRSLTEMMAGARVEEAPYKKHPADFVLWKPSTPSQPGWESSWGRGRPGWHIECSVMIHQIFGTCVDIHGGGQDLIFPHHENELAQSSCLHHGQSCARFWLHNAFVRMAKEKMSKSLGNISLVRDLLGKSEGESLRLALLSSHYRSPLDWNEALLKQAQKRLYSFYECLDMLPDIPTQECSLNTELCSILPEDFLHALLDDLNISSALAAMHRLTTEAKRSTKTGEKARYKKELLACGRILGIMQSKPKEWLSKIKERRGQARQNKALQDKEIEAHIALRKDARQKGDYQKADAIRDSLLAQGIALKDSAKGTEWYYT